MPLGTEVGIGPGHIMLDGCILGPTRVHNPNGISIGLAVIAGFTTETDRQTDRQTDRPRYSVGNSRPHLRT